MTSRFVGVGEDARWLEQLKGDAMGRWGRSRIPFVLVGCLVSAGVWLSGVGAARAASWSQQKVPGSVAYGGVQLDAVSCISANACLAVGSSHNPAAALGEGDTLSERWDGSRWTIQATPAPGAVSGAGNSLADVSCVGSGVCFAVGSSSLSDGVENGTSPLLERWNGRGWSLVQKSSKNHVEALSGVSCVSAHACVAVGFVNDTGSGALDGSVPVVERWNGRRWISGRAPVPQGASGTELTSVSCSTRSSCIAIGATIPRRCKGSCSPPPLLERFDGSRWSIQPLGKALVAPGVTLSHISCTGRTCIAIGQRKGRPFVARWNGRAWSRLRFSIPSGGVEPVLGDVSCASAANCTADGHVGVGAGCLQPTGACKGMPLVERWNGRLWSIQSVPQPVGETGGTLNGVSCAPRRGCVAVGSYSNTSGGMALAVHGIGSVWTVEQSADLVYPAEGGWLTGVSCTSATACVAVGAVGNDPGPFTMSWDGSVWTNQTIPVTGVLTAVSCVSATACMAVGGVDFGSVPAVAAFWNGSRWSSLPTPMIAGADNVQLNGVWCASATWCIAVGGSQITGVNGLPLTEVWNGSGWKIVPAPTLPGAATTTLTSISCTSITACVAVGSARPAGVGVQSALIERWDGSNWTIQSTPSPPATTLTSVSCPSTTTCVAVGYTDPDSNIQDAAARVEGWDGSSWTIQNTPSPPVAALSGVSCTSATSCEAVGSAGSSTTTLAEDWHGSSWTVQSMPTLSTWGDALSAVSCTSTTACQAVGSGIDYAVPVAESLG